MERHIKLIKRTLGLFSSMIYSGENHSKTSEKQMNNALTALEQLTLHGVSKSVAKKYAEFCVRCDREGLPLLELDDYIKQYCC